MLRLSICIVSLLISQPFFSQRTQSDARLPKGVRFVEEVKKSGETVVIPYKHYQLDNGLNILIHEDHSDPICYVDITYHVGSAREQQGRSGFAHFFEHMMFQGSKHVADDQHFKIITEAGGTLNGSTNTDRTNYFQTVPSNQLEKMLWLEADRMGFLLDSVTQLKFEIQRSTVKNERGQRYDNAPYGLVGEKTGEALYPKGHPYSWTTIGYIEDLNRVDVNDLKRFYMRWYGPNNAVLTVAGDVKTADVLTYAQKYFGSIQRGPGVSEQKAEPVKLESTRYISYEDQVRFPMLSLAFPTPPLHHKDDAALDVLAQVLSGSQGSPLYKAFIENKKAVSAIAYQYSRELAGQFQFVIRANAGTPLAETEKLLRETLAAWEQKGVTEDDLTKYKAQYQSNLYNQLATVRGKGAKLASYFTLDGVANFLPKETALNMTVTREDVMRVFREYIKDKPCVVLSCVPKGKGELRARDDNWKMYERTMETESAEYKELTYVEPKDGFNRAHMPVAGAAAPVPVPAFYKASVGAIPLIGVEEKEIPLVSFLISFRAGHRYEPADKAGLASLTAAMLEQSSEQTMAEEIENKLDRLGSSVNFNVSDEGLHISVQSLKKNVAATMKILQESLFRPRFDSTEFMLEKKKQLDRIGQQLTSASSLADITYQQLLYGKEHVMGTVPSGNEATVEKLQLADVKIFYATALLRSNVSIAVSGDITREEALKELDFLTKLPAGKPPVAAGGPDQKIEKTKVYFVDKKGAAQSEIRVGYVSIPYDALGDYYKCQIMNFSFAGAFNSRINYLLREIKGWTYGSRGYFDGGKFEGPYTIYGGFKAAATDSALVQIFEELKKFTKDGITPGELTFTRNAMQQNDALKYESPIQKLYFIKRVLDHNLPKDYVAQQTKILNNITVEEINALAKKYLPHEKMIIVIVADKESQFGKIKKLEWPVEEIDAEKL